LLLKLLTGTAAIPGLRGKNANKKMLHPKPTQPPTLLWLIYGGIYNNKKKPFRAEDIFTQLLVVTAASKKIKRRVAFSSFFQPAKKVVVIGWSGASEASDAINLLYSGQIS
jgi:hypothetical protein